MLPDTAKGLVILACSILLLPLSLQLMQDHDDSEREYERKCDLQYRALIGNNSIPDWSICSQLDDDKSRKAAMFMTSLGLFVLTGLVGTVMVLPNDENGR